MTQSHLHSRTSFRLRFALQQWWGKWFLSGKTCKNKATKQCLLSDVSYWPCTTLAFAALSWNFRALIIFLLRGCQVPWNSWCGRDILLCRVTCLHLGSKSSSIHRYPLHFLGKCRMHRTACCIAHWCIGSRLFRCLPTAVLFSLSNAAIAHAIGLGVGAATAVSLCLGI